MKIDKFHIGPSLILKSQAMEESYRKHPSGWTWQKDNVKIPTQDANSHKKDEASIKQKITANLL